MFLLGRKAINLRLPIFCFFFWIDTLSMQQAVVYEGLDVDSVLKLDLCRSVYAFQDNLFLGIQ